MKKLIVLFLVLAQTAFSQTAWTVKTVPNTRLQSDYIHISDPDNWIDEEYESKINEALDGIRSQADVFVVVLSSIGDQFIENFAVELFNYWGIGDAELDNGVLVLMVEDQHALRFETGYGVEDELPDALCQKIFTKVIVPYFKEGDYNGGLYAGVCSVAGVFGYLPEDAEVTQNKIISLKSTPKSSQATSSDDTFRDVIDSSFGLFIMIVVALLNILAAFFMIREMHRIKKAADPQHGDGETVARLFDHAKTGIVIYPILGVLCLCPLILLIYPFFVTFVNKKKKSYRETPRTCEFCGNKMRRLSEEEEDAFMTDNQRFEENNIKVKDYDIWLCDSCGNKMAVPFLLKGADSYYVCPSCQCLAGKKEYDQVIERATENCRGKGLHHIVCLKCGRKFTKEYTIPKLSSSSGSSSGGHHSGGGGSFGGGHSGGGGYTGSW